MMRLRRSSRIAALKTTTRPRKKAKTTTKKIPSRDKEKKLYEKGYKYVVGIDEAGRGPLAGPVVAAAVYVPKHFSGFEDSKVAIRDSKEMSEEDRERAFESITKHPELDYAFHVCDHDRIDEINILAATMEAMTKSVSALPEKADYALVDGNRVPVDITKTGCDVEAVIKGDSKIFSIACASVVAKVTRDRIMMEFHNKYPAYANFLSFPLIISQYRTRTNNNNNNSYDFETNKGYPTSKHRAAVWSHGACPIHRLTFAPLKTMTKSQLRVSKKRIQKRDRILKEKLEKKKKKK